jgi:hypothetical protein
MDPKKWQAPVKLASALGRFTEIGGADEALECLLYFWPPNADSAHYDAKIICIDALTLGRPAEESRRAFIAAANEVGIEIEA